MESFLEVNIQNLEPLHKSSEIDYQTKGIVTVGRGIQEMAPGVWTTTGLVEVGAGRFAVHTGIGFKELDPNDDDVQVGGGRSNVLATHELIKLYLKNGFEAPRIVFSAGRPKYLERQVNNLSEGSVMKSELEELLSRDGISNCRIDFISSNKRTIDGVETALKILERQDVDNIAFLTIEPHVPRVWNM